MSGIVGFMSRSTPAAGPLVSGLHRLDYHGCETAPPRNLAKSVTVE